MLQHATQSTSVKASKLYRVYQVDSAKVMETDFVPGVPLDTVWGPLISKLRLLSRVNCRSKSLQYGPVRNHLSAASIFNLHSTSTATPRTKVCGVFLTECQFDAHKVHMLEANCRKDIAGLLNGMLSKLRTNPTTFVLTHGDLNPWNIHVQNTGRVWQIYSILDWERSGFLPDYAEYTIAMINSSHSEEWRKVLTEQVLTSCSKERVEAERLATKTFM